MRKMSWRTVTPAVLGLMCYYDELRPSSAVQILTTAPRFVVSR